jgi:hypothetical protein
MSESRLAAVGVFLPLLVYFFPPLEYEWAGVL